MTAFLRCAAFLLKRKATNPISFTGTLKVNVASNGNDGTLQLAVMVGGQITVLTDYKKIYTKLKKNETLFYT